MATYMVCNMSRWIKIAWKTEHIKELKKGSRASTLECNMNVQFKQEVWRVGERDGGKIARLPE